MNLTQLQTLKAAIIADSALTADVAAMNIGAIVNYLNAASTFIVWRTKVQAQQVMEDAFIWTDVDALSISKARIWEWLTRYGAFNPSKPTVRQGLSDCFGAGSAMATAITPHLKRPATRGEKAFATGTGTTGSPGLLVFEGGVPTYDVVQALTQI